MLIAVLKMTQFLLQWTGEQIMTIVVTPFKLILNYAGERNESRS